jgi:hypothetical protein
MRCLYASIAASFMQRILPYAPHRRLAPAAPRHCRACLAFTAIPPADGSLWIGLGCGTVVVDYKTGRTNGWFALAAHYRFATHATAHARAPHRVHLHFATRLLSVLRYE